MKEPELLPEVIIKMFLPGLVVEALAFGRFGQVRQVRQVRQATAQQKNVGVICDTRFSGRFRRS